MSNDQDTAAALVAAAKAKLDATPGPYEVRRFHRAEDETEWIVILASEPTIGWPNYLAIFPYSRRDEADAIVAAVAAFGPALALAEAVIARRDAVGVEARSGAELDETVALAAYVEVLTE